MFFPSHIKNERGSISIEAVITIPVFILITLVFAICLKGMFIYEMIDQCFCNAAESTANNILYSSIPHEDLVVENFARTQILNHYFTVQLYDENSNWASSTNEDEGFRLIEQEFDEESGVAVYELSYNIDLAGLKRLEFVHRQRIRSLWQYDENVFVDIGGNETKEQFVYTSEHGREAKIYHSNCDCWALKRSYKNKGSVKIEILNDLSGYRECKICQNYDTID